MSDATATMTATAPRWTARSMKVTSKGWKNWSADLTNHLAAGTNVFIAASVDFSSNSTPVTTANTKRFFYSVPTSPLVVVTNGNGTLSSNLDGVVLEVHKAYTVKALPAVSNVFHYWQVTGDESNLLVTNLTLTASDGNLDAAQVRRLLAEEEPHGGGHVGGGGRPAERHASHQRLGHRLRHIGGHRRGDEPRHHRAHACRRWWFRQATGAGTGRSRQPARR